MVDSLRLPDVVALVAVSFIPKLIGSKQCHAGLVNVQTVRVSDRGQIVIPARIRRRLGLRKGSTLVLIENHGRIMLTRGERVVDLPAEFSGLLKHTDARFKELWANEADEVWDAL